MSRQAALTFLITDVSGGEQGTSPEPPTDRQEVVIERGELITLSLIFLDDPLGAYISADHAEIHVPTVQPKDSSTGLSFEMGLWDASHPNDIPYTALCGHCYDPPLISQGDACGCLVRFHGRHFPIEYRKAVLCFEFPINATGCEEHQKYKYVESCTSSLAH